MRLLVNELLRFLILIGLKIYYKSIRVYGKDKIPKNKAVLFVSNHQNGLIDPLLIGTHSGRKPFYLARADVFNKPLIRFFLTYIQMFPVYRLRDGRNTLSKNEEIFENAAKVLCENKSLVIFPEGTHSKDRRVGILKNGFVHIIEKAFAINPNLELYLQPLGFNYIELEDFPDRVSMYFGEPIKASDYWIKEDYETSLKNLKTTVFDSITQLTTHIEDKANYVQINRYLQYENVDFMNPVVVNAKVQEYSSLIAVDESIKCKSIVQRVSKLVLYGLNLPIPLIWHVFIKPNRIETEFRSTFRFGFAAITYVMYLLLVTLILRQYLSAFYVAILVVLQLVISRILVKLA